MTVENSDDGVRFDIELQECKGGLKGGRDTSFSSRPSGPIAARWSPPSGIHRRSIHWHCVMLDSFFGAHIMPGLQI